MSFTVDCTESLLYRNRKSYVVCRKSWWVTSWCWSYPQSDQRLSSLILVWQVSQADGPACGMRHDGFSSTIPLCRVEKSVGRNRWPLMMGQDQRVCNGKEGSKEKCTDFYCEFYDIGVVYLNITHNQYATPYRRPHHSIHSAMPSEY